MIKPFIYKTKSQLRGLLINLRDLARKRFECPVCGYRGPFLTVDLPTGKRKYARCPRCKAFERHRLQFLVVSEVLKSLKPQNLKILHFAPEPFFRDLFVGRFGCYESADLSMSDVDHAVDLQKLPFADQSYDFVYASHVLEHVPDDLKAIAEIRRVLRPGGIAILPVPIIVSHTIEYTAPNPNEEWHVRAPGLDYYDRYKRTFNRVETFASSSFPDKYQTYIHENRRFWPTETCSIRTPLPGRRHLDVVPVCYV